MTRADLKEAEYESLLRKIVPILLQNGLKCTTMDNVAATLGMSKRTLYEIFESKKVMIGESLKAMHRMNQEYITSAFSTYSNVMEALIAIFKHNRDLMETVNVEFYRDMDRLYKENREDFDKAKEIRNEKMLLMFQRGVDQGMFRPDVDYSVQSRMIGLQMEAFKRIEEFFPPDMSIKRVFDAIMVGFLRSIASPKGMEILDRLTKEL